MTDDPIWLPARQGPRPKTTPTNPHTQLEQTAPVELQIRLRDHVLALPGVRSGTSQVSVPGAVAFYLDEPGNEPQLPDLFGGEWGHIHPDYDGSLHVNVPTALAEKVIEAGWGEFHTLVGRGLLPPLVIMLYGPRDEAEFAVCRSITEESYLAHGGAHHDSSGRILGLSSTKPGPVDPADIQIERSA